VLKLVIKDATRRTEKGDPIADAFNASPYVPKMVCKMISIGETTGKLDSLLARVSIFYTEQVNTAVDGITSLIEPVMIAFLGVIIGGVMLAMFMPIFKMSSVV
jgi:type IV pilus assembly protein PilC